MTATAPNVYLDGSPWTGGRTAAVFVAWFAGGIVGGIVADAAGFSALNTAPGLGIAVVMQSVAALVTVWWYGSTEYEGAPWSAAGLVVRAREWYGVLLGALLQWAVGLVLLPLVELLDVESEPQAVTDLASETLDAPGRVWLFVAFVVLAPLVEEVLFRGVLLGWLVKRVNHHVAVVASALLFGLVHWEGSGVLPAVLGLMLIGVVLGYVAVRRGNLSLPILMHAGINLLAYLVIVNEDRILEWIDELESGLALLPVIGG